SSYADPAVDVAIGDGRRTVGRGQALFAARPTGVVRIAAEVRSEAPLVGGAIGAAPNGDVAQIGAEAIGIGFTLYAPAPRVAERLRRRAARGVLALRDAEAGGGLADRPRSAVGWRKALDAAVNGDVATGVGRHHAVAVPHAFETLVRDEVAVQLVDRAV